MVPDVKLFTAISSASAIEINPVDDEPPIVSKSFAALLRFSDVTLLNVRFPTVSAPV